MIDDDDDNDVLLWIVRGEGRRLLHHPLTIAILIKSKRVNLQSQFSVKFTV